VTQTLTLKQRAYENLRQKLESGQFKPGMRISDGELAKEFGIGRTPVREAFLQLESEGFLQQVPRQGTFVKTYDRHELQCIFELREALEAYAAGKAAEHMEPGEIERLEQLCDQQHAISREGRDAVRDQKTHERSFPKELVERSAMADLAFHFVILHASANPFLNHIVGNYRLMTRVWTAERNDPYHTTMRTWVATWRDHHRILRAIKRRDPEAARHWMSYHLSRASASALRYYDQVRRKSLAGRQTQWARPILDSIMQFETAEARRGHD